MKSIPSYLAYALIVRPNNAARFGLNNNCKADIYFPNWNTGL